VPVFDRAGDGRRRGVGVGVTEAVGEGGLPLEEKCELEMERAGLAVAER
jgi:hypothetical protein